MMKIKCLKLLRAGSSRKILSSCAISQPSKGSRKLSCIQSVPDSEACTTDNEIYLTSMINIESLN